MTHVRAFSACLTPLLLALSFPCLARKDDRQDKQPRNEEPSEDERRARDALAAEVSGAIAYTRKGRVFRVDIGDWRPVELGPGEFVRFSPDGKRLAVYEEGAVFLMDADGRQRRKLTDGVDVIDDIPIAFHPDGRRVVFTRKKDGKAGGLFSVDLQDGQVRPLDLPDAYTGEMRFSADGKRLATRVGRELYAVDVAARTHRKYGFGCSPGVSPDGSRLMNNVGGHKTLVIRAWDGSDEVRLDTKAMSPDREWNNHHWSNHADYITAQGEGGGGEAYVVRVSQNRATRVTWQGKTSYPDLFVASAGRRAAR